MNRTFGDIAIVIGALAVSIFLLVSSVKIRSSAGMFPFWLLIAVPLLTALLIHFRHRDLKGAIFGKIVGYWVMLAGYFVFTTVVLIARASNAGMGALSLLPVAALSYLATVIGSLVIVISVIIASRKSTLTIR